MFDDAHSPSARSPDESGSLPLLSVLPGFPSRGTSPITSMSGGNGHDVYEELRLARKEIELLKSMDPFRAADMAIQLQVEKMHAAEASSARDSAVQRLASAYDSIKEKAIAINHLKGEKLELEQRLADAEQRVKEAAENARAEERCILEGDMQRLRDVIRSLKDSIDKQQDNDKREAFHKLDAIEAASASTLFAGVDDSFSFTTAVEVNEPDDKLLKSITSEMNHLSVTSRPQSAAACHNSATSITSSPYQDTEARFVVLEPEREPAESARARNAFLASLPIPLGIPEDVLSPIMIPPQYTLQEFLANAIGSLKYSLSGYRAFHDKTTFWCPEREEHGYFLTPLFKCTTKPRVQTAHCWSEVDPRGRMTKPTETFYSKGGKWYYAGQYIALRLENLSTKEWEGLDPEVACLIVKETLAGRKNTSPTVQYEVSQLYSAGALRVACVGLQCVGFNIGLYQAIMEQASKCLQTGRWKSGRLNTSFPALDGSDMSSLSGASSTGSIDSNSGSFSPSLLNFV